MNWKDHPVVVAVIACVGTLTVGSTIVSQFIIPTWLQLKDNQIAVQKTQLQNFESQIKTLEERLDREPKTLQSEVAQLRLQLQMSESDNVKLRQDLETLDPDSLFAASNVYPRGFRAVRIGDDVDIVRRIYAKDVEIKERRPLFVSVTLNNSPHVFSYVTYYYGDLSNLGSGDRKIFHILFQPEKKNKATCDLIKNALVAKYGDKIMKLEKDPDDDKTTYVWPDVLGYELKLFEDGNYHIQKNQ